MKLEKILKEFRDKFDGQFYTNMMDDMLRFISKTLKQNHKVEIQEELWAYSHWLLKNGYCDTDITQEEPYAVDEYLKEKNGNK